MHRTFSLAILCLLIPAAPGSMPSLSARAQDGTGSYEALVALYDRMRASQRPAVVEGMPDYSAASVAERRRVLDEIGQQLDRFDSASWPRPRRIDHLLVLAQWRAQDFDLRVMKPWARDPLLYVDLIQRVPFVTLPLKGEALDQFRGRLLSVPRIVGQARVHLTAGADEQTTAAIRSLEKADGVGHGYPYRPTPPPGVLGWFDDLLPRLKEHHPALVADAVAARDATKEFRDWLVANKSKLNAPSGIGLDNYDYYQRYVRLMPYTSADNLELGERELERSRAFLALERWKNRKLPPLNPASSAEDYAQRIKEADEHIRRFIREQEILTIPDYIQTLDTNVPWLVRPGGRNFWEEVQYRDPRPDHVHAVIPGHRFDGVVHRQDKRPIRGSYSDGGRSEGWAFYLEEMFLQAGLLDDLPRTKELFYVFQIKRATRNKAEIMMHANRFSVPDAVKSMMDNVEMLDEDVARVDAEIYLRRPAYGSGYQMGKLQMDQLLSDRFKQLGAKFNLKQFHDDFLAAGTIPISLIRYEMTGLEDQLAGFWTRVPPTTAASR